MCTGHSRPAAASIGARSWLAREAGSSHSVNRAQRNCDSVANLLLHSPSAERHTSCGRAHRLPQAVGCACPPQQPPPIRHPCDGSSIGQVGNVDPCISTYVQGRGGTTTRVVQIPKNCQLPEFELASVNSCRELVARVALTSSTLYQGTVGFENYLLVEYIKIQGPGTIVKWIQSARSIFRQRPASCNA